MGDLAKHAPNLTGVTQDEEGFIHEILANSNGDFGAGRRLGVELDLLLARYNQQVTSAEMLGALHLMVQKTEWAIHNSLYNLEQQKKISAVMARLQDDALEEAGLSGLQAGGPLQ